MKGNYVPDFGSILRARSDAAQASVPSLGGLAAGAIAQSLGGLSNSLRENAQAKESITGFADILQDSDPTTAAAYRKIADQVPAFDPTSMLGSGIGGGTRGGGTGSPTQGLLGGVMKDMLSTLRDNRDQQFKLAESASTDAARLAAAELRHSTELEGVRARERLRGETLTQIANIKAEAEKDPTTPKNQKVLAAIPLMQAKADSLTAGIDINQQKADAITKNAQTRALAESDRNTNTQAALEAKMGTAPKTTKDTVDNYVATHYQKEWQSIILDQANPLDFVRVGAANARLQGLKVRARQEMATQGGSVIQDANSLLGRPQPLPARGALPAGSSQIETSLFPPLPGADPQSQGLLNIGPRPDLINAEPPQ